MKKITEIMIWTKNRKSDWSIFLLFLTFYLYVLSPTIVPYRDSGEMICDAVTLGIAHQPGYPLYVLISKVALQFLFWGSAAYKMNLLSAMCGALALFVFYRGFRSRFSVGGALLAILFIGFNFTFITVSTVSEMYSMNLLFAGILFAVSLRIRKKPSFFGMLLFAYLCGLFMGNRMDIILSVPAFFLLFAKEFYAEIRRDTAKKILVFLFFGVLGFSVYAYLLVRSASAPLLDWSHPATISNFLWVIMRKSYGSTLDLISKNYVLGELFLPNLKYYLVHILNNFNFALLLLPFGIFQNLKRDRKLFFSLLVLFLVNGPFYLFLANMPPNPHALAIVEPNYLLPDVALAGWIGMSVDFFWGKKLFFPFFLIAFISLSFTLRNSYPNWNRRQLFFAQDFSQDVFRSLPQNSIIIAKKDVQLFSLWHRRIVEKKRDDLKIVAQGLSAAAWYLNSKRMWHPELHIADVNKGGFNGWKKMAETNIYPVFATLDAEIPPEVPTVPRGMANRVFPKEKKTGIDFWKFFNLQWLGRPYNDFFCEDLARSYENSLVALAAYESKNGGISPETAFRLEVFAAINKNSAQAELYAGFYYSAMGDWKSAGRYFLRSALSYENLIILSDEYYAFAEVKEQLNKSCSYSWLNYGVAMEKMGFRKEAEEAYNKALSRNQRMAQAHYNLAILYWKTDQRRVVEELRKTLEINPGHKEARYYLNQFRRRK